MGQLFAQQGWGDYSSVDVARGAGIAIVAVSVACLVIAIGVSVTRMRQRRPSFWVPLVCAAVWLVLTIALVFAAVASDPAFAAAVARAS